METKNTAETETASGRMRVPAEYGPEMQSFYIREYAILSNINLLDAMKNSKVEITYEILAAASMALDVIDNGSYSPRSEYEQERLAYWRELVAGRSRAELVRLQWAWAVPQTMYAGEIIESNPAL